LLPSESIARRRSFLSATQVVRHGRADFSGAKSTCVTITSVEARVRSGRDRNKLRSSARMNAMAWSSTTSGQRERAFGACGAALIFISLVRRCRDQRISVVFSFRTQRVTIPGFPG